MEIPEDDSLAYCAKQIETDRGDVLVDTISGSDRPYLSLPRRRPRGDGGRIFVVGPEVVTSNTIGTVTEEAPVALIVTVLL